MEIEKETSDPNNTPAPFNSGGGAMGSGRRGSRVRKDETRRADWELWSFMPRCEPWQAVALSLDLEPPEYDSSVRGWPAEYERRLKITAANIEGKNIQGSVSTPRKSTSNNPCTVELHLFGAWAKSLGWTLPDSFPVSPPNKTAPAIFDKASATYPPELDIALLAWKAVSATDGKGKPKLLIKAWLNINANHLSGEAKERIAVVCNWDRTGGATRSE